MTADFERLRADWLSLDEAVARILNAAEPLPSRTVPLVRALGRVLARPGSARIDLPPFDNSAMDGYAVRAADIAGATRSEPRVLPVVSAARAGAAGQDQSLAPGQAIRIMTGARVPDGADTVVRVEHTDAEEGAQGKVRIFDDADAGRNIRPGGQDFRAGDQVMAAGLEVTPGWTAVLAAAAIAEVEVHRRPRVAVLTCGDELRPLAESSVPTEPGTIVDSNGPALAACLTEAGAEPVLLGIARDDPGDLRARIHQAMDCDALVTVGGASMGEADLLKRTLLEDGLELDFWRVRIRPGSPFSFGWLPRETGRPLPVFGLPGNPSSAFVTFQVLVRPWVRVSAGRVTPHRRVLEAVCGEALRSPADLCHLYRVTLEGGPSRPVVRLTGPQGSGLVSGLGLADGLAVVPEGIERLDEGAPVQVILLDDDAGGDRDAGYRPREARET